MSSRYDAIVIGAGHNGLATATMLAKQGRNVVVLERRKIIGGLAASESFDNGYRSAGVLHDTSALRGWAIDQLELKKFDLNTRREAMPVFIPQKEGPGYLHWRSPDRAKEEISVRSESDAKRYKEYRGFINRVTPALARIFDQFPPDTQGVNLGELWDLGKRAVSLRLLGKNDMMELLRVGPMCVADWVGEWFESEILRAAVAAPAVLQGFTGPWSPGTGINLLLYEALYQNDVEGGPPAVIRALEQAASSAGVEVRTEAGVGRLNLVDGAVVGVTLENGEVIEAPTVAASCHPKHLFLDLIPPQILPIEFEHNITNYRSRGTAAKINLALSHYPKFVGRPNLEPARIRTGTSIDDLERSFDPVKYRDFPLEPVLDIYVPTVESPGLAPDGHHVFSILVHWVPYNLEGGWDDEAKQRLLDAVLNVLSTYAPDVHGALVSADVQSPVDLEKKYGVTGGHLLHGEQATDQLVFRPTPECSRYSTPFRGLYLCGSGSHPGGGITCAPGTLAVKAITSENS
jgi:phytoene dehydrogenase-like protein